VSLWYQERISDNVLVLRVEGEGHGVSDLSVDELRIKDELGILSYCNRNILGCDEAGERSSESNDREEHDECKRVNVRVGK
jgi:hypothetical protein